jgi:hypothetical protein
MTAHVCPACNRRVPKPKPPKESPFARFWREAFVTFAFSQPWPWSPLHPSVKDREFRPGILRLGTTGNEQTVGMYRAA